MKWITRERPRIGRIACPWLIRRFIEANAELIHAPTGQVLEVARRIGAAPSDSPAAEPFPHDGEPCGFDAFIKRHGLAGPALGHLAAIARGADTARPDLARRAAGPHAVSLGLPANIPGGHAMPEQGMAAYDPPHTWRRGLQQEAHDWAPPAAPSATGA